MLEILIAAAALAIGTALIALALYARWHYGALDGLGFPVIPPTFILGSCPDLHTKVQHHEDIARMKEYGPVWGLYQGRTPLVYISDPELIRQIWVKDTAHFFDREAFNFGNKYANEILDYLPGEKWKTMRVMQTKLFSSGRIKQLSDKVFKEAALDFVRNLDRDTKSSGGGRVKIEARGRFQVFTIDITARSTFSMKVEDPEGPHNAFYKGLKKLVGEGQDYSSFYTWTLAFPFLSTFEPTLIIDKAVTDTFQDLLAARKASGAKLGDFGDILNECMDKLGSPEYKKHGITQVTLIAQAMNLFLAGFDRIATIMTFFSYHLAENPQIQARVHGEIDEIIHGQNDGLINYDTVSQLPFLTACISEVLRLYPTFIRPERVCTADWTCPEYGIKIPKGQVVMIASWAANRNPKVYEEPDHFKPERFLPGNKASLNPYAFSSFGFGHRNCIGTRFAYESLRIGLATIFNEYRFEARSDTKLKFKPGVLMILQYEPVYLDAVKRK